MNRIGFIGLGIMGSRMARNLQKAGYALHVHNRTEGKAEQLIAQGAEWAPTPAAAAEGAEVVITMLAHPQAVEGMALGEGGFLDAMAEGALWMDCSTVHPRFSRRMAAEAADRGLRFVDAPVGGTKQPAEKGELTFIMGGAEGDITEVMPLVEVMGARHLHIGEAGMGVAMKVVINHMLALSMAAFAEGAALGEALGIPQKQVFNAVIGSAVAAPFLEYKRDKMQSGTYEADFPLKWMSKDLRMVAEAAADAGVEMSVSRQTAALYQAGVDGGHGDADFAAIYAYVKGLHHEQTPAEAG